MALEIDGLAILCAIAETPQAFPAIRQDVNKAAQALVTKQIKARGLTVAGLRQVQAALGPQPFALIVDGMKDAEVKTLAVRLDRHDPDLKAAKPTDHRRRLLALAAGTDPVAKPAAPARSAGKASAKAAATAPATARPRTGRRDAAARPPEPAGHALDSAAMAAIPPRRRKPAS